MATNPDFSQAVSDNAVSVVKEFLRNGEPPCDYVLFLAIRYKANAVLRVLIRAGADLDAVEHPKGGGCTPLMRSISAKNMQAFRMLLKAGASINKRGSWEYPLHVAAEKGSVDFAKTCVAAGANVHIRDRSGNTPLMIAALFGHLDVVKLLLRAGANPLALNRVGQTACEIAAGSNKAEVVELLEPVSRRRPPYKRGVPALMEALKKQDMAALEKWLAKGVDVNATDRHGFLPMEITIGVGALPFVQRLIKAGANLNKIGPSGISFLESALRAEQWETAKLLLRSGAVSNPPGNRFEDAFFTAICSDDVELMKELLAKGSNPRAPGLLLSAARAKSLEAVRFLLAQGADANEEESLGWTPLIWAVWVPRPPWAKSRGKRVRPIGATPASYPKLSTQKEMVGLLIKYGADVNHVTEKGETALTLASSPSLVRLLKEAGASNRRAGN